MRQQAITWANVDSVLCLHLTSLGHDKNGHHSKQRRFEIHFCEEKMCLDSNFIAIKFRLW